MPPGTARTAGDRAPHEPRGAHPLVVGEDRQLRTRLDRIDVRARRKPCVQLDDPGPHIAGPEDGHVRIGGPFQQCGHGKAVASGLTPSSLAHRGGPLD